MIHELFTISKPQIKQFGDWLKPKFNQFGNWVKGLWNDITGQTAITKQNEANMSMAKYQAQMQEDFYNKYSSPSAIMRQLQEAGLNPNLAYGAATGGQSNVPSFDAPNVERNMSGSDKLNKALSLLSSVQGIRQQAYQTSAAREVAEQQAIKTRNDLLSFQDHDLDHRVKSSMIGASARGISAMFKRSSLGRRRGFVGIGEDEIPALETYSAAMRSQMFNNMLSGALKNRWDYGIYYNNDGYNFDPITVDDFLPNAYWNNRRSQLSYELDSELKKLGVYGRLGLGVGSLLFGR